MKINRSAIWFIVIVAVMIASLLWQGKKTLVVVPPVSVVTNTSPASASGQSGGGALSDASALATTNTAAPVMPGKGAQIKDGLAKLNDVGIVFYGRLEDQHGNAVANTPIDASVRIYNGIRSTVDRFSVESDANGLFHVKHGNGESLSLMPNKAGYVFAMTKTTFNYSYMYPDHFTPDPDNPTVIKMWKLEGAEPLVNLDKNYRLHYTNAPIYFDLVAGEIVQVGGDLKITVNRPAGEVSEHNPQKWSIVFEVMDGGFIETSDKEWRVAYAAPENGYQPSDIFQHNNGTDGLDKHFFVQSRKGQVFSKIYLSMGINNKTNDLMYISFHGFANTNSSRNWEATAPR